MGEDPSYQYGGGCIMVRDVSGSMLGCGNVDAGAIEAGAASGTMGDRCGELDIDPLLTDPAGANCRGPFAAV